jgi:hypothetical protein
LLLILIGPCDARGSTVLNFVFGRDQPDRRENSFCVTLAGARASVMIAGRSPHSYCEAPGHRREGTTGAEKQETNSVTAKPRNLSPRSSNGAEKQNTKSVIAKPPKSLTAKPL